MIAANKHAVESEYGVCMTTTIDGGIRQAFALQYSGHGGRVLARGAKKYKVESFDDP